MKLHPFQPGMNRKARKRYNSYLHNTASTKYSYKFIQTYKRLFISIRYYYQINHSLS